MSKIAQLPELSIEQCKKLDLVCISDYDSLEKEEGQPTKEFYEHLFRELCEVYNVDLGVVECLRELGKAIESHHNLPYTKLRLQNIKMELDLEIPPLESVVDLDTGIFPGVGGPSNAEDGSL